MPYRTLSAHEFREDLLEKTTGPWGDAAYENTFSSYFEKDQTIIKIEYKHCKDKNGKNILKWRIPGLNKVWVLRRPTQTHADSAKSPRA